METSDGWYPRVRLDWTTGVLLLCGKHLRKSLPSLPALQERLTQPRCEPRSTQMLRPIRAASTTTMQATSHRRHVLGESALRTKYALRTVERVDASLMCGTMKQVREPPKPLACSKVVGLLKVCLRTDLVLLGRRRAPQRGLALPVKGCTDVAAHRHDQTDGFSASSLPLWR